MALISGIFESNLNEDGTYDRAVDEEFFARYHAAFLSSGVYPKPANSFQVTADGGLRLRVKPGSCLIQGYYAYDTADALLTLSAAGISTRTDRVVARLNKIDRRIEIAVKTGGADAPGLTRNSDVYELALADIRVAANALAVTQANITDQRANNSLCGFVYNPLQEVDTTDLFAQYDAGFRQFMETVEGVLSDDVAGNLLTQIHTKQDKINSVGLLKCTGDGEVVPAVEGTDYVGMETYNALVSRLPKIAVGRVEIIPSAPNTPTRGYVKFPEGLFRSAPSITVSAASILPGTGVLGVTASAADKNGFDLYLTRTDRTPTGLYWQAIQLP